MNLYLDLFFTFARIGVTTFGGGLAMLPILQREVVERKGWASNEELTDYYAIGQCTPGIIAVNTATFIGYKQKGAVGGIVATLGLVFPSLVIICLIAAFLQNFADLEPVRHALAGVNAAVVALMANSVRKLSKTTLKNKTAWCICLSVLTLAGIGSFITFPAATLWGRALNFLLSPAPLIIAAGVVGFALWGHGGTGAGGDAS